MRGSVAGVPDPRERGVVTASNAGYKAGAKGRRALAGAAGSTAAGRELRTQGRKTMARLLDAGLRAFAERGYHAARVDDVVRAARTSHGTFYLYFSSKEDLLRALAAECAAEWGELAQGLGAVGPDDAGRAELRRFLAGFVGIYRRYGPVIRAWLEDQVDDKQVNRLGLDAFTRIATSLTEQMRTAGAPATNAHAAALMALLERFTYFAVSRPIADDDVLLDTLATTIHRGFFVPAP
jgi:AcrR family transcriptional regulator